MTEYIYDNTNWPDYETGADMEWCLTNGLGGYCSGSLIGSLSRTHQGYLVAALYPPTQRYVTLEKIRERIVLGDDIYDLDTAQIYKKGTVSVREGYRYLKEVRYDDASVIFSYECGSDHAVTLNKTLAMKRDTNAVAIAYDVTNNTDDEITIVLTPLINFREHDKLTYRAVPKFNMLRTGNTLSLVPRVNQFVRIDLAFSPGEYMDNPSRYEAGSRLIKEIALENEGLTSHNTPCEISFKVPPHSDKSYSVLCHVICSENLQGAALLQDGGNYFLDARDAHKIVDEARHYYNGLKKRATDRVMKTHMGNGNVDLCDDTFVRLALGADHFLSKRTSTGTSTILAGLPWFTDWGRDTMIAFTGLTLCTRRYDEAGLILLTFTHYIKNGLIPNMFPDDTSAPLYNTADASLWFFIAVYRYIKYLKDDPKVGDRYLKEVLSFIKKDIFPALLDIAEHYENGTDYSIYMENNGLIHAGSDLDQVTWMDVRVGDKVMTPRHGCPVEINALWYNALCIMDYLCKIYGYDGSHYASLATTVRSSFTKAFWNDTKKCLYDVVEYDGETDSYPYRDPSIRPNQILAIALPFSVLSLTQEKSVVAMVEKKLYVGKGLRSLSQDSEQYHGVYAGALEKRDEAYHQGTAWSYLLGSYISAYRKVYGPGRDCTDKLMDILRPILTHMESEGAIGGISEVFDGDPPHNPGGCYDQAWSVGEILRAYTEDILPYR